MGVVGAAVLLLSGQFYARAQRSTEIFIPLGRSPGLSGKVTVIGKIAKVSGQDQTITIAGTAGTWNVGVTDHTWIWLDRSKLGLLNKKGTFTDLREGLTTEVKYVGSERKGPAEWIKVQLAESGAEATETPK